MAYQKKTERGDREDRGDFVARRRPSIPAGDKIDLNLTFPEEYGNTDLAGQAVVFEVTVNAVKESTRLKEICRN